MDDLQTAIDDLTKDKDEDEHSIRLAEAAQHVFGLMLERIKALEERMNEPPIKLGKRA